MLVTVAIDDGRLARGHVPDEARARRDARRVLPARAPRRPRVGAVSRRLGFGAEPIPGGAMSFVNWILGIVLVYTALFGIGKIVFGQLWLGFELLDVAAVCFILIMWSLKRQEKKEGRSEPPQAARVEGSPHPRPGRGSSPARRAP